MSLGRITESASRWTDLVAEMVVATMGRFRSAHRTQFVEMDGDAFSIRNYGEEVKTAPVVQSVHLLDGSVPAAMKPIFTELLCGSDVEIVLRSNRFVVRPLELPKRAREFLDGIVRSQIDRLTPWSATDAVFGYTRPIDVSDDRISLMVVATARTRIEPYVQALTGFGANSITVSMQPEDGIRDAAPIKVFEQGAHAAPRIARVRHWLLVVLAGASLAAAVAAIIAQFMGDDLEAQTRDVNHRIAERRVALIKGRNTAGGTVTAQHALERRKYDSAASVIVLEALSRILPDHTYLTELRVEGNKLQIVGITREAPSLIRLMEDSPNFTRATFFAPTTRSSGDPGERFHIEARIKPVFTVSQ